MTNHFFLVPPKTSNIWMMNSDWFNPKELSRGGRRQLAYMLIIAHDLRLVLVSVGVNGLKYCLKIVLYLQL